MRRKWFYIYIYRLNDKKKILKNIFQNHISEKRKPCKIASLYVNVVYNCPLDISNGRNSLRIVPNLININGHFFFFLIGNTCLIITFNEIINLLKWKILRIKIIEFWSENVSNVRNCFEYI